MIFSDGDIKKALAEGRIKIDPPPQEAQYSSTSVDLRINDEFKQYDASLVGSKGISVVVEFGKFNMSEMRPFLRDLEREKDGSVILRPNSFVLSKTLEKISLPLESQIAARVEGRSTTARLGLVVHLSAPTIHAGFEGPIVLEIYNQGPLPIKIRPNQDQICQLIFEQVLSMPSKENATTFQNQTTVTGSAVK